MLRLWLFRCSLKTPLCMFVWKPAARRLECQSKSLQVCLRNPSGNVRRKSHAGSSSLGADYKASAFRQELFTSFIFRVLFAELSLDRLICSCCCDSNSKACSPIYGLSYHVKKAGRGLFFCNKLCSHDASTPLAKSCVVYQSAHLGLSNFVCMGCF